MMLLMSTSSSPVVIESIELEADDFVEVSIDDAGELGVLLCCGCCCWLACWLFVNVVELELLKIIDDQVEGGFRARFALRGNW